MTATRVLEGETALVTGANGGLGSHFAKTLARAGASVALAARRPETLEALRASIADDGGRAVALRLDVTKPEDAPRALDEAQAALGPVTILVNNAGVAVTKPLLDHTEEDWRNVMGVNLDGAWRVAQAAARQMVRHRRGGSIVNVASVLGIRVTAQVPSYAASKAGLIHLTRAMAVELARYRIRVNALAPGYVATPMNRDFFASEAGQAMVRRIPQRRLGQPEDLDGALLLLVSEAGIHITGSVLSVDGGHHVSSL